MTVQQLLRQQIDAEPPRLVLVNGKLLCPQEFAHALRGRNILNRRAIPMEAGSYLLPDDTRIAFVEPLICQLPDDHPGRQGEVLRSTAAAIAFADPHMHVFRYMGAWWLLTVTQQGVALIAPDHWLVRKVEAFERLLSIENAIEAIENAPEEKPVWLLTNAHLTLPRHVLN